MIDFEHDPDEPVQFGTTMTLRTAVQTAMAMSPKPIHIDLFRDVGEQPPILGWEEVEWLAILPAYR